MLWKLVQQIVLLILCGVNYNLHASLIQLPQLKTPQDVETVNQNFRFLFQGKLDIRPGSVIPLHASISNLGSVSYPWNNLYVNYLTVNSTGTFGSDFGALTHFNAAVGGVLVPNFQYNESSHRIYSRSLMLSENADTVDMAIRRFNGTFSAPTNVLADEFIGNLYWQPYGSDGTFEAGSSPNYGRIAQIAAQTDGIPTGTSRGGKLVFFTTPLNGLEVRERAWITSQGFFVACGGCNYENGPYDGAGHTRNAQNDGGYGPLTVYAPTLVSTTSAIAVRNYTNTQNGFDIDFTSATDAAELTMVTANTKTKFMSVDRASQTVTLSSLFRLENASAIRGTITPPGAGCLVYNTVDKYVCQSTGTTSTSWVIIYSTGTACAH